MCNACSWEAALDELDDMLSSGDFDWASETLEGIQEWIKENEHATEGQLTAIGNIAEKRR
jgi:hypothetical protein